MTVITGMELTDEALSTLSVNLPAAVAALNADPNATVQIENPTAYRFASASSVGSDQFPYIEVGAPLTRVDSLAISSDCGEAVTGLYVIAWVWHAEHETMIRQAYQFSKAICAVMLDNNTAGDSTSPDPRGVEIRVRSASIEEGDRQSDQLVTHCSVFIPFRHEANARLD